MEYGLRWAEAMKGVLAHSYLYMFHIRMSGNPSTAVPSTLEQPGRGLKLQRHDGESHNQRLDLVHGQSR